MKKVFEYMNWPYRNGNVAQYCGRAEGFEEKILKNVGQWVSRGDVLIHLGDFCIYKDAEWHKRFMDVCAGKRWLVRGNHDRKVLDGTSTTGGIA